MSAAAPPAALLGVPLFVCLSFVGLLRLPFLLFLLFLPSRLPCRFSAAPERRERRKRAEQKERQEGRKKGTKAVKEEKNGRGKLHSSFILLQQLQCLLWAAAGEAHTHRTMYRHWFVRCVLERRRRMPSWRRERTLATVRIFDRPCWPVLSSGPTLHVLHVLNVLNVRALTSPAKRGKKKINSSLAWSWHLAFVARLGSRSPFRTSLFLLFLCWASSNIPKQLLSWA